MDTKPTARFATLRNVWFRRLLLAVAIILELLADLSGVMPAGLLGYVLLATVAASFAADLAVAALVTKS